jgi:hypothetical protein
MGLTYFDDDVKYSSRRIRKETARSSSLGGEEHQMKKE